MDKYVKLEEIKIRHKKYLDVQALPADSYDYNQKLKHMVLKKKPKSKEKKVVKY